MSAFLFILTSLYARRVRCSFMVMACLKKSMRWKRKDLLNALVEFQGRLPNSRVGIHIDQNRVLKCAVDRDDRWSSTVVDVAKDLFHWSRDFNFSIQTFYLPSSLNPADEPSQDISHLNCMLTPETWLHLECFFGPHSFDLMTAH